MNKRSGLIRVLSLLSVLVLVGIIFYSSLSSGYESNKASEEVALFITNAIRGILNFPPVEPDSKFLDVVNAIVRKFAHFTEYLILCGSMYFACHKFCISGKKTKIISLILTLALACIDETIQFFVPGRDGRVTDVFIDASGAVIALAVIKLFDIMAFRKKQGTEN